jgi:hypothetical protein
MAPKRTRRNKKQKGGVRGNPGRTVSKVTKTRTIMPWNIRNHYVNMKRQIQLRQAGASTDPILRMTPRRQAQINRNTKAIIEEYEQQAH